MSQERDTSESRTKTSGANTRSAKARNRDLDAFQPSGPDRKIDDKAATLEKENIALKAEFRRERFVYLFVIAFLFCLFVGSMGNGGLFFFSIVTCLVLLIGMAKWLEFPWVIVNLEKWHDALLVLFKKRGGKAVEETEPLPAKELPAASNPPNSGSQRGPLPLPAQH